MNENELYAVSRKRKAGVLLHPTSLPSELNTGDIGHQAYRYIEFLQSNGFKVWQMLPLGPTHDDKSPYQCMSSHAGNPLLISLDWLQDRAILDRNNIALVETDDGYRSACLQQAAENFYQSDNKDWAKKIATFCKDHQVWLDDFALFTSFKKLYQNKPWYEWPSAVRHRDRTTLDSARQDLELSIKQTVFEQFIFFTQWHELREYAKQHEVEFFGDIPIFVARDSADVWSKRENFLMDSDGDMEFVAGVPPDAFSETGQRWGNPLYNWDYMLSTNFSWWKECFKTQLELFDMIRIDHFRGLQACWQIPDEDETAINGNWIEVPGRQLLSELFNTYHHLPLVAEDLGVITDDVIKLKNAFNLPGMKVLQFAFDGNNENPHLPHCHTPNDLVYTGTHDNNTTLGWVCDEESYNKKYFNEYLNIQDQSAEQDVWSLIRQAMSSVSFLCVLPMQDLLILDSSSRMNIPGTVGGNWDWRFEWSQIKPETTEKILHFMALYQR